MSDNPLGIKRFGPVVFSVQNSEKQALRFYKYLGMKKVFSSPSEDMVVLQQSDVFFLLDSRPTARARAQKQGNVISEIGIRVESADVTARELEKRVPRFSDGAVELSRCKETGAVLLKAPHDGEVFFRFLEDEQPLCSGVPTLSLATTDQEKTPLFQRIDHIVTNTQKIAPMVAFFEELFG
ncbi:hypothetical protein MRY87_04715, partial [bacterium]|nr:hypothetical protein [bacterium]